MSSDQLVFGFRAWHFVATVRVSVSPCARVSFGFSLCDFVFRQRFIRRSFFGLRLCMTVWVNHVRLLSPLSGWLACFALWLSLSPSCISIGAHRGTFCGLLDGCAFHSPTPIVAKFLASPPGTPCSVHGVSPTFLRASGCTSVHTLKSRWGFRSPAHYGLVYGVYGFPHPPFLRLSGLSADRRSIESGRFRHAMDFRRSCMVSDSKGLGSSDCFLHECPSL